MKKLFLILLLPLSVYSQSTQEQIDSLRYYMHKELNEYRLQNNVDKLQIDANANAYAQAWAKTMYRTGNFNHGDIERSDFNGENILSADDYIRTCKESSHWTLWHWKESPGHNKNLLDSDFKKVGYGFYKGYAVQVFQI